MTPLLVAVLIAQVASSSAQDARFGVLPPDVPADARVYSMLSTDRPGRQVTWRDPDGTVNVISQQRHPDGCQTDVRSTISVDAVGAIVYLRRTGRACEPARVVDEHYSRSGSLGFWRNGLERGQGDVIGKKFYASANAVPEERALLVRALLASGHQLELLPAGDARLERVGTQTIRANATEMLVTQYRVHGIGGDPLSIWLDSRSELFALAPDVIRHGWESAAGIVRGEAAGSAPPALPQGLLPDAAFETTFRKFTPPETSFSPFYSWDAVMALQLAVYRRGAGTLMFDGRIQAVGTRNFGSRVGVGGTGYVLRVAYTHAYSDRVELSAGISHLSSHLTRDLDEKIADERRRGAPIPIVDDPDEYNALFARAAWKLPARLLAPEFVVALSPVNFRFRGGRGGDVRPVFVSTGWTLWRRGNAAVLVETRHEFGRNALHDGALALEVRTGPAGGRRLQIFLNASPGRTLHVSPHLGGVRDGVSLGVRLRFRASAFPSERQRVAAA